MTTSQALFFRTLLAIIFVSAGSSAVCAETADNAPPPAAVRMSYPDDLSAWASVISTGLDLMAESRPTAPGMTLRRMRQRLDALLLKTFGDAKPEDRHRMASELYELEADILAESMAVFSVPAYAESRDSLSWPQERIPLRRKAFREEVNNTFLDWDRNAEALARHGLPVSAAVEQQRITAYLSEECGVSRRLKDQAVAFYKQTAEIRFLRAATVIGGEIDLAAFKRAEAVNTNRGVAVPAWGERLADLAKAVESLRSSVCAPGAKYGVASESNMTTFRSRVAEDYEKVLACRQRLAAAAYDAYEAFKPGASLWSTGRFSMGGSWHGLLNSNIRRSSLFMDIEFRKPSEYWSFSFDVPDACFVDQKVTDASWVHSRRDYLWKKDRGGETVTQQVCWSIIAPGTLVDTGDSEIRLSQTTSGLSLPPDKVGGIFDGQPVLIKKGETIQPRQMSEGWLVLLWEDGACQYPVVVVFEKRPDEFAWRQDGLIAKRGEKIGRMVFTLPFGAALRPVDESVAWQKLPEEFVSQCRSVARLSQDYPLTLHEYYACDASQIRILNQVESISLQDDWGTGHLTHTPFPPMLALGMDSGVPITARRELIDTGIFTKYGPYRYARGSELEYTIPRIRLHDYFPLSPVQEEPLVTELNDYVQSLYVKWEGEQSETYKASLLHTTAAKPAWCMLRPELRDIMANLVKKDDLAEIFSWREPSVYATQMYTGYNLETQLIIEPTMGKSFWAQGWRGGRHGARIRGDIPNYAAALTLEPMLTHAKLFGQWDLIERNRETLERSYSSVAARQEWVVPGHDCMTSGFNFSTDMLADGWRCHAIMNTLARTLRDRAAEEQAAYLAARTMMSLGALLHPNLARYNQHIFNRESRLWTPDLEAGWEGFVQYNGIYLQSPKPYSREWAAFSGVFTCDYPIYGALLRWFPESFRRWASCDACAATPMPSYEYGLMRPQRVRNKIRLDYMWDIVRINALLGDDPERTRQLGLDALPKLKPPYPTMGTPHPRADEMPKLLSRMPFVIAAGDPLFLSDWGKAKLLRGEYDRDKLLATLEFASEKSAMITVVIGALPTKVCIDGAACRIVSASEPAARNADLPVATADCRYAAEDRELLLSCPAGTHTITIQVAPETSLKPAFDDQPEGTLYPAHTPPPPGTITASALRRDDCQVGKTLPVDLAFACNMGFHDEAANDRIGGTTDDGESWEMTPGESRIRGVTFSLIDPEKNGGKSCIVLAGRKKPYFPERVEGIKVNRRVSRLFFYQAAAWREVTDENQIIVRYVLHFADGQDRTIEIRMNREIKDWKDYDQKQPQDLPKALIAPVVKKLTPEPARGIAGYVYEWKNDVRENIASVQEEQKGIPILDTLDIVSENKAVPVIFAITAESDE
jgi:hypothetical protein